MEPMLEQGQRLRVARGDGSVSVYPLAGSHAALRAMQDQCYAATREAIVRWPVLAGGVRAETSPDPDPSDRLD